jgi:hypothetical protein
MLRDSEASISTLKLDFPYMFENFEPHSFATANIASLGTSLTSLSIDFASVLIGMLSPMDNPDLLIFSFRDRTYISAFRLERIPETKYPSV